MTKKPKILVVDDDKSVSGTLKVCIEAYGAEAVEFDDGSSAFEFLRTNVVDLILSDISMPKMDGLSLTAAIRSSGISTPIVLISGNPNFTKERVICIGANDLVEKPFTLEAILLAIESHVSKNHIG